MTQKVKLAGRPDGSTTWIWLEDGRLKVEYYAFSEPAIKFFGNDIAWTIMVNDMEKLVFLVDKHEASLIPWMEQYLKSCFGIKQWAEENEIDFSIKRESWA